MMIEAQEVERVHAEQNARHTLAHQVADEALVKLAQEHGALYLPLIGAVVAAIRAQVEVMDNGGLLKADLAAFWKLVKEGLIEDVSFLVDSLMPQEPGTALM